MLDVSCVQINLDISAVVRIQAQFLKNDFE